jgi:hypothetical protein
MVTQPIPPSSSPPGLPPPTTGPLPNHPPESSPVPPNNPPSAPKQPEQPSSNAPKTPKGNQRRGRWWRGWSRNPKEVKEDTRSATEKTREKTTEFDEDQQRQRRRGWWRNPKEVKEDTRSAIEKMRDKVAEFDEDYKNAGERILGFFMSLIGYTGPFLLVVWVGTDLGRFFESTMGAISAFGLSYTIEAIIAGCTVAMGRAFEDIASGKANWGKCMILVAIWLILNASSAFGLYLVITNNGQVVGLEQVSMGVRVVAIALADLGCSAVLMMKGRSLQKHIESIRRKATAIGELADAQRGIEEADKNAALREKQMQATLKIQEDLSTKIGEAVEMVMSSILHKMEKALNDDSTKNERGYGRR